MGLDAYAPDGFVLVDILDTAAKPYAPPGAELPGGVRVTIEFYRGLSEADVTDIASHARPRKARRVKPQSQRLSEEAM